MSTYKVTVNGVSYDVEVEAVGGAAAAPVAAAPAAAPKAAGAQGGVRVEAQVAGKIFNIVAAPGEALNAGDTIVILESMKMEIPVVAPADGVVASIEVEKGQEVEVGYLIATMN